MADVEMLASPLGPGPLGNAAPVLSYVAASSLPLGAAAQKPSFLAVSEEQHQVVGLAYLAGVDSPLLLDSP